MEFRCECGHVFRVPAGPVSSAVCPACQRTILVAASTPKEEASPPTLSPAPVASSTASAVSSPPGAPAPETEERADQGIQKIFLEKGWITEEQLKSAIEKQQASLGTGKKVRIGEVLVEQGILKPEQVREALKMQGKTPLRCPACRKNFNVYGYRPGTRSLCPKCKSPLVPPGSTTDIHVEDTGGALQHIPVGDAVDPSLVTLFPGYTIERRLGAGGMGEVFLARQKSLDRLVAMKVLPPDLAKDANYVTRFLAEARAAAKLKHENIVGAVDTGEASGRYFFVMEYVEGETLQEVIRREKRLDERRALQITRQVVRGLDHAQKHGLIHRDIKPANIMIGMDGVAKICDFGLAREIDRDVKLTQAGMVHASPAYSSPEQCKGQRELDPRSDMYSLGATLFEMVTGDTPFKSDVPSALFVAHVTQAAPTPSVVNPSITPAMNNLILRLLRKNPDGRFKDYAELLRAVDDAESPRVEKVIRVRDFEEAPKSSKAKLGIGVGAGAVILIVILIFALRGGETTRPETGTPATGKGLDAGAERDLKEARAAQDRARANPGEYPSVRDRWKSLEEKYRGKPQHPFFAGPLLEFEALVAGEAERAANVAESQAVSLTDRGKPLDALNLLRGFNAGYAGTEGARIVAQRIATIEKDLENKFGEAKQTFFGFISREKFDDARRHLEVMKSLVSAPAPPPQGIQYVKPGYRDELDGLARNLEEEIVFARKRAADAQAKNPGVTPAPTDPKPTPDIPSRQPPIVADVKPRAPVVKPPEVKRPAVPDATAQKEAEKLVREIFKDDYAKKTNQERYLLARKMIQLAGETQDDPIGRFVLLREARDLAAQAGEIKTAFQAIDTMARLYDIEIGPMHAAVLAAAGQSARTPEEQRSLANAYLLMAVSAFAAGEYEEAERAATSAGALARRAKDIPLVAKADAKAKEALEVKAKADVVKKSREALAKNPQDPAANLVVGKFECFTLENWETGLPLLAKGSDPALKTLAATDLESPADPMARVRAGDAWWDAGEKETGATKDACRARAVYWYGHALPALTGIHKTRIEKRISEAGGLRK